MADKRSGARVGRVPRIEVGWSHNPGGQAVSTAVLSVASLACAAASWVALLQGDALRAIVFGCVGIVCALSSRSEAQS